MHFVDENNSFSKNCHRISIFGNTVGFEKQRKQLETEVQKESKYQDQTEKYEFIVLFLIFGILFDRSIEILMN